MSQVVKLWWLLIVAAVHVWAAANETIDDADPRVHWAGNANEALLKGLDVLEVGLDESQLFNGTVNQMTHSPEEEITNSMEMNFTSGPGAALYLFLAQSTRDVDTGTAEFFLDGVNVGTFSTAHSTRPAYKIPAYINTSIPTGSHTLGMAASAGFILFDYVIVNPGNVISSSSPAAMNTGPPSSSSAATSTGPVSAKTSAAPLPNPEKNVPVGAIVGGCVGGIAVIVAFLVGLLVCRRARRRRRKGTTPMEQSVPPVPAWQVSPQSNLPAVTDPVAAERIKLLEEQMRRLTERAEGSSAAGSEAETTSVSVGRSLSTMKREQTRAVQERQQGHFGRDALVHTDSGLRLTAGRVVEELPPTYVAA